jgi:hypothetical protein
LRKIVFGMNAIDGVNAVNIGGNLSSPTSATALSIDPPCGGSSRFMPNNGDESHYALTRRDAGMHCNFNTQTVLRETAALSLPGITNLGFAQAPFPRFSAIEAFL